MFIPVTRATVHVKNSVISGSGIRRGQSGVNLMSDNAKEIEKKTNLQRLKGMLSELEPLPTCSSRKGRKNPSQKKYISI